MSAPRFGATDSEAIEVLEGGRTVVDLSGHTFAGYAENELAERLAPEASRDSRLRVAQDALLMHWAYDGGGTQPTHLLAQSTSTFTIANFNQSIRLNSAQAVNLNSFAALKTYATFALPAVGAICVDIVAAQQNCALPYGYAGLGFGQFLTSGAYFKFTERGTLQAVLALNSVEYLSEPIQIPANLTFHTYSIHYYRTHVDFLLDSMLVATLQQSQHAFGQTDQSFNPVFMRTEVGATNAALGGKQLYIRGMTVYLRGNTPQQEMGHAATLSGHGAYNNQNTRTVGQTSNYSNSSAPGAAGSWSPSYTTLGGQWRSPTNWPAVAETDYTMFSYVPPNVGNGTVGHGLYITGVRIGETFVTTALTGGPFILQWSLALAHGSTMYRIPLGYQTLAVTAAVGTVADGFDFNLTGGPIYVPPGRSVVLQGRVMGTTVTAGVIRGTTALIGYWE